MKTTHILQSPNKMAGRTIELNERIQETFYEFALHQDDVNLTNFLNSYSEIIPEDILDRWFRKVARLPGNWTETTDRNAWLNQYYLVYVPPCIRGNVQLTNRRIFQRNITHQQRIAERERIIDVLGLPINTGQVNQN